MTALVQLALTLREGPARDVWRAGKWVENRSWAPTSNCPPGTRIAIHGGAPISGIVAVATVLGWAWEDEALGAARGLTSAQESWMRRSGWWHGPCGWYLADIVCLVKPVPCRGAQRLWRVPVELAVAIQRAPER